MFRHPFLDGRLSDGADAMTVYRDTLKFDQRMLTLKKARDLPALTRNFVRVMFVVFLSWKRMKIISCCFREVYNTNIVI